MAFRRERTIFIIIVGLIIIIGMTTPISIFKKHIIQFSEASSVWVDISDTDFNNGIPVNITIQGSGQLSYLELQEHYDKWVNKTSSKSPHERLGHYLSPVWGTDKVILFGGWDGGGIIMLNDTWEYDFSDAKWTKKNPPVKPMGRYGTSLVPIYGTDKLVLFGGKHNSTTFNDTWIYDLSDDTWTEKTPIHSPDLRVAHRMVPIWNTKEALLFGGLGINHTWIYNLTENKWNDLYLTSNPPNQYGHVMDLLYGTDKIVMFGGEWIGTYYNETWIFDYGDRKWTKLEPPIQPEKRRYHAMASIYDTDKAVLFGGSYGNPIKTILYNDTWIFDGSTNTWTKKDITISPHVRDLHSMSTIFGRKELLLFGGYNSDGSDWPTPSNQTNDTWIYYPNYYVNGTLTSQIFDAGTEFSFKTLTWDAEVPADTSISFQLRSSKSISDVDQKDFLGPDGTSATYYTNPGSTIWQGHSGDQYIQYKAYLNTLDLTTTPVLKNVTISYNYFPDPKPKTPMNKTITNINTPDFTWTFNDTDSSGQSAFRIIIDDDIDFQSIDYDSGEQDQAAVTWDFPAGTSYTIITDGKWYWKVRVKDTDGDWSQYSEPFELNVDTKSPTSQISYPVTDQYYNQVHEINGTAMDTNGGSGIDSVEILLQRQDNGEYWDGAGWVSGETWIDTSGNTSWTYDSGSIDWISSVQYTVRSRAIDNATNIEIPGIGLDFNIDQDRPWTTIDNIANNSYLNSIFNVFGTSGDAPGSSGVGYVEISLMLNTNGTYWTGNSWDPDEIWHIAEGTNPWSFKLNEVPLVTDNYYTITSRAVDIAGNTESPGAQVKFMYDTKVPENLSISINDGAVYTNTTSVTLSLYAEDTGSGVADMKFTSVGTTWTNWEEFNTTREFTLSENEGKINVFFKVQDRAGNAAEAVSSSIILDTKPPEKLSITINSGDLKTNSTDVELSIGAEDTTSGIADMSFSTDGDTWSDWEEFNDTKPYTLSSGDGTKTVYVRIVDRAGNIADPVSASIVLDTSIPDNYNGPDDGNGVEPDNKEQSIMVPLLIALIIVVITVILIVIIFIKKRKKPEKAEPEIYPPIEEEPPQPEEAVLQDQPMMEQPMVEPTMVEQSIVEQPIEEQAEETTETGEQLPKQPEVEEQRYADEALLEE